MLDKGMKGEKTKNAVRKPKTWSAFLVSLGMSTFLKTSFWEENDDWRKTNAVREGGNVFEIKKPRTILVSFLFLSPWECPRFGKLRFQKKKRPLVENKHGL